ncbi:FAD/NAD(P)-binding protein [Pseudomonas sp. PDM28]|uniref:FAD/NAD(P)-binding protein n=1 Tax=Pseudomonas sp. PDM28 TaxID=2854770 RepID=UPI001C48255B|nr:FAD/NAD(P)-binding protein [Pseudomonas sp. PDM28]MBV7551441.1 FAD/NAD(P)-binding protein [Pseudomonas sp. PDM28]
MQTIVIIGAGFSGTATAVQLLRQSPIGLRIVMVNRSVGMARGIAYGTNSPHHWLNVPAGNMSALADDPQDFLRYCQKCDASIGAADFVSRKCYGDYLAALLNSARGQCRSGSTLTCLAGEALALRPRQQGAQVELSDGRLIEAAHVVLAFGHFAPLDPKGIDTDLDSGRYQRDPWAAEGLVSNFVNQPVLLLGSGLTAMDVALSLERQTPHAPIYLLSRRGLLPLPHRAGPVNTQVCDELVQRMLEGPATVRCYMQEIRRQVRLGEGDGVNWRDVFVMLRPHTATLWQRLAATERRRFLRHAQAYWDIHRHRVAPSAFQAFQSAVADGRLKPMAGRIKTLESCEHGLRIGIQLRGSHQLTYINVAQLINCTGPNSDLRRVDDRLIKQLQADGLISIDPDGMGLRVDTSLAVKDREGRSLPWLSYVGPMLKADYWEATAVPELRQHAWQLARKLIAGAAQ